MTENSLVSVILASNLIIGIVVFLKSPRIKASIYFALLVVFLDVWSLCVFFEDMVSDQSRAELLTKTDFSTGVLAAFFFLILFNFRFQI